MKPRVPKIGRRTLHEALAFAMLQHQRGLLPEAEKLYRRVLAAAPDHPDALHYLGVV
ncbi:MAG: tetratricopeptide repeat protein [Planctomycetota bacterium]